MDDPYLPDPLNALLRQELQPGERILWQGRPLGRFRPASLVMWLFAIPWTAFALFWTGMAWTATQAVPDAGGWGLIDWVFPLFGLPFVLVGFGMLASPFLAPLRARRTLFAITDQRVLRLQKAGKLDVQSLPVSRVGGLQRTESRDGSGTLRIELADRAPGDARSGSFELPDIPNVRMVESRLREAMDRAARPTF
ncbi:PH domain-containing protein [Erythrobacter sp. SG61-1L]|uniref:PH domain-containing protein n=1 Tax=Erythrobacter sp. SG61-1L TaxID=1603897 RepID=UPI0006C8ED46|nr:PH domain-containing protein [Erythrobacter sp. SG61-1L]